ncbi:LacI family DNA-binding transcriptional regulator [Arthrobacter castelli]|uniref:LacI family DNA-binding transcriptional regulator n=1 Tax=Arthrobacter castelli TaxID=271431 RepID=UPI0003FB886C|nr:LacI family DNA-binding transcriptional regulator [Arthrobacter castelli]
MTTIYEVAERAGVSPATVSRVFNGSPVSAEKTRHVRKAAADLNFVPNRTARTLRRKNSEMIALILPDIENPYFTSMARGVEDVAQAAGYSLVLCNTDDDPGKESQYLDIAASEHMAGVVLAPVARHADEQLLELPGRPLISVDRTTGLPVDAVMMDNFAAGKDAVTALYQGGYRRIACITGPDDVETAVERARGWKSVVDRRQMFADPGAFTRFSTFRVDGGRTAMASLLESPSPPDAVVAANNVMSIGALQVLAEAGMRPPHFGVATIGDLPFTTISPKSVTVVHLPARHMGVTAAQLLIERIQGDPQPVRTVVLRHETRPAAYPHPAGA